MSWSASVMVALLVTSVAYLLGWAVLVPHLRATTGRWVRYWRSHRWRYRYVPAHTRRTRAQMVWLLILLVVLLAVVTYTYVQ